ncbi:MAG TPA: hypothetical protein VFV03_08920, partial [Solirubrobacteraceae bacterium]|nr:hypothetical protein [Solirubrobacteraceae bacterium]
MGAFDAEIAREESLKSGPWINARYNSVPVYTVPSGQPTVRVTLDHSPPAPSLSAAWSSVPLPKGAKPATGTDAVLVVWQPSTSRLWEFWRLVHRSDGWHASWGGAMRDVADRNGVYGSSVWPGAQSYWGVSASSLAIAGGLITLEDLQRGRIEHALSIAIPNVRAGVY